MTEVLIALATTNRRDELPVPDEVLHAAVALFRLPGPVRPGPSVIARQVFDTSLETELGAGLAAPQRRLRFEADGLELDVRLTSQLGGDAIVLDGWLNDQFSGRPVQAEVVARVAPDGRTLGWTHTDASGEFLLTCGPVDGLQLQLLVPGPRPVIDVVVDARSPGVIA